MDSGGAALLSRLARRLLYCGLFASSFLVFRVGPFTVGDLLLAGSLVLMAIEPGTKRVRPLERWAPVAAFFVVIGGLLSAYRSLDVSEDIVTIGRIIFLVALLPWQTRTLLRTPIQFARALSWWMAGAAITCGGTILQALTGPRYVPGGMITDAGRFSGFTENVSDTGGIACVAIVIAVAGLSRSTGRGFRLGAVVTIAFSLAGLVLSGSVAGMLATAVGILYLLVRGNIRPGRAILLGAISVAGLVVVLRLQTQTEYALNPWERLQQTLGLVGDSDSLNTTASRLDTMAVGLQSFLGNPLIGVGLDGQSAIAVDGLAVHNLAIAALYQGGILFFIGLIIPIVSAVRRLWLPGKIPQYLMQANVAFCTAIVFALTAPSVYNRYFWLPAAFSYAAAVIFRDQAHSRESPTQLAGARMVA